MQITRYASQSVIKLEFSRQIFGKSSNIKFHENPSSESPVVPCGRATNRQTGSSTVIHDDEANIRSSQLCEGAYKHILFYNNIIVLIELLFDL